MAILANDKRKDLDLLHCVRLFNTEYQIIIQHLGLSADLSVQGHSAIFSPRGHAPVAHTLDAEAACADGFCFLDVSKAQTSAEASCEETEGGLGTGRTYDPQGKRPPHAISTRCEPLLLESLSLELPELRKSTPPQACQGTKETMAPAIHGAKGSTWS